MKSCCICLHAGKIRFTLFKRNASSIKIDQTILEQAGKVCCLYNTCFNSLKDEIKMDILIGLGCNGALVSKMWHFLWLTLGLDVEKIVQATAIALKSSEPSRKRSNPEIGPNSKRVNPESHPSRKNNGLFNVLTLCCQATQYRLM